MLDKPVIARNDYTQILYQLREALDILLWLDKVDGVSDDAGFVPDVHMQFQMAHIEELNEMLTGIRENS